MNNFVLELLHAHSMHNATQSFFSTILNLASKHLIAESCPPTYRSALNTWKPFFSPYRARHVCVKCSFLYLELVRQGGNYLKQKNDNMDKCPHCNFERFDPTTGAPHSIFRWWPLKELFRTLFLTPEKAGLVSTWNNREPNDEKMTCVYGTFET